MTRLIWGALAILFLAGVGGTALQSAGGLWPYPFAARGALGGAAIYLALLIIRRRSFLLPVASTWTVVGALAGAFWCCVPVLSPTAREILDVSVLALGAAVSIGTATALGLLGAARSWGVPEQP